MLSLAFALALAASGCATSGRRFEPDSVPKIAPGRTTQEEIGDMFGPPLSVRGDSAGRSVWRYDYREEVTHDTRTLSRIGAFLVRLFGGRSVPTPVNVAYSNETRHELTVFIGADGIVDDYTYERSENPRRRIY